MLPRSAIARSNALALRRAAARRSTVPTVRFQSTSSSSSSSSSTFNSSHVVAGVAGGATVILAGYGWYHTSGLKTAVQTSKDVKAYLQSTRDSVVSKARETAQNPSQALSYLRGVAKSYSSFVPGASSYVDTTFDELDELHNEHGEEMDSILKETMDELHKVASEGKADTATAMRVYEIVGQSVKRLQGLAKKVGGDLLEKNPAIKEKLGGGYEQLQSLAEKAGPEGKKTLDEVTKQLKELISKGKFDEDTLKKARDLIQEKVSTIQKLVASSGGAALAGGGDKLQSLFGNIPGADEVMKKAPHFQDALNLAQERSEDAKKLAKETFADVMAVLEEKGKKAKELSEKTKEDAEKKAKK